MDSRKLIELIRQQGSLNPLFEEGEKRRRLFFEAWKEAVALAGPWYFGPKTLETAKDRNDLRRNVARIDNALGAMGGGEAEFIAAVVSFYNPTAGAKLSRRLGTELSMCGLMQGVDWAGGEILGKLVSTYHPW